MKRVVIIALVIAVSIVTVGCVWHKKSDPPAVSASPSPSSAMGYVTDSANAIDQSAREQLETTLAEFKRRKTIDFSVVTVRSSGDQSARDYSLALARERANQLKTENNRAGLLLLVAVDDRKWHIQITRNLEPILTNETLTELSPSMTDSFQEKRYGDGIIKYVNAVIAKLADF